MSGPFVHEAEALWNELSAVEPYPDGVLAVPEPIVGTAFFPGGFGLWNPAATRPLPCMPIGDVMVLGHDFHSEVGYQESLRQGFESPTQPTWRGLTRLLAQGKIALERCFFTNVYMGLRAGDGKTGRFPGAASPAFVGRCRTFLIRQLAMQRPRVILTLGIPAARFLGALSPALSDWAGASGQKEVDTRGPLRQRVCFDDVPGLETTVVALTHPSLRHANIGKRRFGSWVGHEAELAMLREAVVVLEPDKGA
jgi:hypothetical protein